MRFFGDAFYYFAWRFVALMQTKVWLRARDRRIVRPSDRLDPTAVRNIRNWLIEHSDKPQGQTVTILEFSDTAGLILGPNNEHDCAGLYRNAEDLIVDVRDRVTRFVETGQP